MGKNTMDCLDGEPGVISRCQKRGYIRDLINNLTLVLSPGFRKKYEKVESNNMNKKNNIEEKAGNAKAYKAEGISGTLVNFRHL